MRSGCDWGFDLRLFQIPGVLLLMGEVPSVPPLPKSLDKDLYPDDLPV